MPETSRSTTFISYSHQDADFATKLASEFEAAGTAIWMDRRIAAGKRWDREVQQHLDECDRVVVILSPESVASENVLDEVDYALGKGKDICPFLLRDCEIPMRLRRIERIDARDPESIVQLSQQWARTAKQAAHHGASILQRALIVMLGTAILVVLTALYFRMIRIPLDGPALRVIAVASLGAVWLGQFLWWRHRGKGPAR